MRRLYSTFANGPPGAGLLLLRVVFGTNLLIPAILALTRASGVGAALDGVLSGVLGLLLLAGLWTPIAGVLAAILALVHGFAHTTDARQALLLGSVAVALALLGPGAWSMDARRFGWKQIQIPHRNPPTPPLLSRLPSSIEDDPTPATGVRRSPPESPFGPIMGYRLAIKMIQSDIGKPDLEISLRSCPCRASACQSPN